MQLRNDIIKNPKRGERKFSLTFILREIKMELFKKKKIFIIKFHFESSRTHSITELVKGYDAADAWERLRREHHHSTISLEGIDEYYKK